MKPLFFLLLVPASLRYSQCFIPEEEEEKENKEEEGEEEVEEKWFQ